MMTQEEALTALSRIRSGVYQLSAAAAQSQLDMKASKHCKTGKHAARGPLEQLDTLAVYLAKPHLQALDELQDFLNI